ncbi:uncharacterized protein [Physcomitrium patens]|uniref:Nicotinamide/nicotinic acid mononucleotide adenylyltransferase n=1 Tax=Physcomitrium patens TaxID=3218 RepID=A0A2K1JLR9_PHYPA|nr:uncharacterized protein LOC112290805 [Physcomitrium patens]PNR42492.1 hypothetical protein PHYPA_017322 [Physcomitrium patens]|eukprot:XP_024393283.1 uncharacterized protein LOC112290805 [Physcomitrella patens]
MDEGAPPTPVVLESSLSSSIMDLGQTEGYHHNFGTPYGREGREGNLDEGNIRVGNGGGVGVGEDEEDKLDKECEGMGRKRRAEIWQDAEMDALVRAFREVHMKLTSAAGNGKKVKQIFKSANDKWQEVRMLLLASGVDRQPKEIERKWSNLSTAFKQIADWNNNKKMGRPSYWDLDETLKKEKTKAKELPATFRVQLFEAMAEFMGDRQGPRSRSPAQAASPGFLPVFCLPRPSPAPGVVEVPLPLEKLGIHGNRLDAANQKRRRVVILAPGRFNPPTYMHLRMFELGRDALVAEGYHVLGGYMSPFNDLCHKKGLAPAEQRIRMCELAVADSPFIMVDPWEAKQNSYQRTLTVLARIDMLVNFNNFAPDEKVKVMLLCGTDVLESIATPGVWLSDQVRTLLHEYGIVCINRDDKDARRLVFEHEILYNNRRQILVVDGVIENNISTAAIRRNLSRGLSVKYLIPDSVIDHINMNHVYS